MPQQTIQILLVEDNDDHAEIVRRAFRNSGIGNFTLTTVKSLKSANRALEESNPNLVIADFSLPDGEGIELLSKKRTWPDFPLIMMTSHGDEDLAVKAMKAGALDYVVKSNTSLTNLPRITDRVLREWEHITERKCAEAALRKHQEHLEDLVQKRTDALERTNLALVESEENFRAIFEQAAVGMALSDLKSGRITRVNKKYCEIIGYSYDEILRLNFNKITHPDDLQEDLKNLQKLIRGEVREYSMEKRYIRKDNTHVWVNLTVSTMCSVGKKPNYYIAVIENITDRKKTEVELQQAKETAENSNRAKSEFLANMSHEIRTPMSAILGFSELLAKKITDQQQRKYLSSIRSSGKSLLNLINDILDLSKIEAGKLKLNYTVFNPHFLIEEVRQFFSHKVAEKGLRFYMEIDPNLTRSLLLDEIRLRQILINLVGNAIKFTRQGYIRISVREQPSDENHSQIDLILSIEDTGIGIPEDQLDLIFGAFDQQKGQAQEVFGGTGLGLTITKRLVEMMGGRISVISQVGRGSAFSVTLEKVAFASISDLDVKVPVFIDPLSFHFEHASILIVDDIETNRNLIKEYLEPFDFSLFEAINGEEAIELTKRYSPDLVLMDMKMPVLDGYEATRQIKADEKINQIPILALTASARKHSERQYQNVCDSVLRKPINQSQLIQELAKYLRHIYTKPKADRDNESEESSKSYKKDEFLKIPKPKTLKRFPELVRSLERELSSCKKLQSSLMIPKIKDFADRIIILGEEYQYPSLKKWAGILHSEASSFDIIKLPKTLKEFPDLIERIRSFF